PAAERPAPARDLPAERHPLLRARRRCRDQLRRPGLELQAGQPQLYRSPDVSAWPMLSMPPSQGKGPTMLLRTAICAALLLCHPQLVCAQDTNQSATAQQDLASRIDAAIAPYFKADAPGATVIVLKDGKPVLRRAYGMADTSKGINMTPEM